MDKFVTCIGDYQGDERKNDVNMRETFSFQGLFSKNRTKSVRTTLFSSDVKTSADVACINLTTPATITATPPNIRPLTYHDGNEEKEIECNTTLQNFKFEFKSIEKGTRPNTARGQTIEDCIEPAKSLTKEGKFYLSKKGGERCYILKMKETPKTEVMEEDGTDIFFYCS